MSSIFSSQFMSSIYVLYYWFIVPLIHNLENTTLSPLDLKFEVCEKLCFWVFLFFSFIISLFQWVLRHVSRFLYLFYFLSNSTLSLSHYSRLCTHYPSRFLHLSILPPFRYNLFYYRDVKGLYYLYTVGYRSSCYLGLVLFIFALRKESILSLWLS